METIEVIGIVVGVMVTVIELVILFMLWRHSRLILAHFDRLDEYTRQMDAYSDRMGKSMEKVKSEVEDIYKRVCVPTQEELKGGN